jgi:futalosine hydrolase
VLVVAATDRELEWLDGAAHARLVCGVGPVEAAVATARALAERRPRAVVNVGLAGSHGFAVPELVLGSEARYRDTDSALVPTLAAPDPALLGAARAAWPEARVCPIGTSARVGGATGCEVEAMEGFAVLRACELARVPALEARVTCNDVAEPDRGRWLVAEALELLAVALPTLLEALDA